MNIGVEGVANYYFKQQNKEKANNPDHRQISVLAGHEFIFGKFSFAQFWGTYLFAPYYDNTFFQRYSLTFDVYKGIMTGVTLKAHKAVAENFNFLMGYKF